MTIHRLLELAPHEQGDEQLGALRCEVRSEVREVNFTEEASKR
jgi:hypothetical protein